TRNGQHGPRAACIERPAVHGVDVLAGSQEIAGLQLLEGRNADPLVAGDAVGIDEPRLGHAAQPVGFAYPSLPVQQDRHRHRQALLFDFPQMALDAGRGLALVDSQVRDAVAIAAVKLVVGRQLLDTGLAPRGPKVDVHRLAAKIRQADGSSVQGRQLEGGGGFADLHSRLQAFGIHNGPAHEGQQDDEGQEPPNPSHGSSPSDALGASSADRSASNNALSSARRSAYVAASSSPLRNATSTRTISSFSFSICALRPADRSPPAPPRCGAPLAVPGRARRTTVTIPAIANKASITFGSECARKNSSGSPRCPTGDRLGKRLAADAGLSRTICHAG